MVTSGPEQQMRPWLAAQPGQGDGGGVGVKEYPGHTMCGMVSRLARAGYTVKDPLRSTAESPPLKS